MEFSRLRLSGFKSFVEPTELYIEPGLTGVVGPNGCGKSNLLEAIRWVMGENRAKSLRGGAMDDVIFAGTDKRPPRNLAEVTLVLDNFSKSAPAGYNDHDMIEVTRRIERDSGSSYRINGQDVRQKDVQLLFADAATGAHSPALVSQGRIGSLINAKPQERRLVLEEAAGISGLHQRRKEAESRLRGAEGNLTRLQDVVGQMEQQIASLKRQARQAERYKAIAAEIRQVEASLLYSRWFLASQEVIDFESKMRAAESVVAAVVTRVAALSKEQAAVASLLPDMREADARAAASLQRLGHEKETLENEAKRREETYKSLLARRDQLKEDRKREDDIALDSEKAIERLSREKTSLSEDQNREKEKEISAREALSAAQKVASDAEREFDHLSESTAQARARKSSLESDLLAINRRLERLTFDENRLQQEREQLDPNSGHDTAQMSVQQAEEQVTAANSQRAEAHKAVEKIEEKLSQARTALSDAQSTAAEATGTLKALSAEVSSLQDLINSDSQTADTPVGHGIKAKPGFETAVGAVLGEDINSGVDANEKRFWQSLESYSADSLWPEGVTPLADVVTAPSQLSRRLQMSGIIAADFDGYQLSKDLKAGQRLVDKAGNVWRWDGFVKKAGAASRAATRMMQQNLLTELSEKQQACEKQVREADTLVTSCQEGYSGLQEQEKDLRSIRADMERKAQDARRTLLKVEQEAAKKASRLNAIEENVKRLVAEKEDQTKRHEEITSRLANLPNIDELETTLAAKRAEVETYRTDLSSARTTYDGLAREAQARQDRLQSINTEMQAWNQRISSARRHLDDLFTRAEDVDSQLKALEKGPEDLEERRKLLLDALAKAEETRRDTSDKLVKAEADLAVQDEALKRVAIEQTEARENQIRLEAAVENASDRRKSIAAQIGERFECAPTEVLATVGVEDGENLTSQNLSSEKELDATLERLKRERDKIGAVNLRAEEELAEIDDQMGQMVSERRDLEEAIARLRKAIGDLNKEGRERLLLAFEEVNAQFTELFSNLFGGGQAHLKLVESDDPLEAGLEIFASPPGKRLQILSLLSGGEQALTALSLIFAVFITNPSPICVLDEVDAPLDDANVDRFCGLLDDMIARTKTRFLIVTHNAVSMARVHRLFGVTMAEKGVSTLVSVDLEKAEEILEG